MTWFSIPEGYSCVIRQSDTSLYAYQGSRRDTFILNGLSWQKSSTSTGSSIPPNSVCVSTPQIPSTLLTGCTISSVLIVLATFSMIYKMIRRVYL